MMSTRPSRGFSESQPPSQGSIAPSSHDSYQTPDRVQEMRDLFSMLDKDGDGIINATDLAAMLTSLGLDNSPTQTKQMLSSLPSPIDFPTFLTHLTNLSSTTSPRDEIIGAFTAFDENDSGYVNYEELKRELVGSGNRRMTVEQVEGTLGGVVERTGRNRGRVGYGRLVDGVLGERKG